MRYSEILTEKTIRLDDDTGHTFIITKNPTRQQFFRDTSNPLCDIKGLLTARDFYYWPAWHAHHGQIAHRLGLEGAVTIFVRHDGIMVHKSSQDLVEHHPVLLYLYGDEVPMLLENMR